MRPSLVLRLSKGHLGQAKALLANAFDYPLPKASIAHRPLRDRSASKLLVVRGAGSSLEVKQFSDLPELLPSNALVVRNSSRVIPARLFMQKRTGGHAEVMLLSPVGNVDPSNALESSNLDIPWNCFVGGRRIKKGDVLQARLGLKGAQKGLSLVAHVVKKDRRSAVVDFSVQETHGTLPAKFDHSRNKDGFTLQEAISKIGHTPLPPYIRREAKVWDKDTYQTVYADREGSVAAPTAGLHMTEKLIDRLHTEGINFSDVVLHVGAGTFAPLEGPSAGDHSMHEERASVSFEELRTISAHLEKGKPVIALGTTSLRTLESLYWLGVGLIYSEKDAKAHIFAIHQWEPYLWLDRLGPASLPCPVKALNAVLSTQVAETSEVIFNTKLLIVPGYHFKIVQGLITNFHQPKSTLLMLVAAFLGPDCEVRTVYQYALRKQFRFLSYGDSSLLLPKTEAVF